MKINVFKTFTRTKPIQYGTAQHGAFKIDFSIDMLFVSLKKNSDDIFKNNNEIELLNIKFKTIVITIV